MKPIPPPTAQQDQEWNRLGDFANGIVKKINAVNANAILQHFQLRVMEAADTLLVLRRTPNAGVHARDSATVLRSQYDAMMQAVYLLADPPLFNERVLKTVIPRNVRLSEAPSYGKPIILYDIRSRGAQSYLSLAREIIERKKAP